MSISLTYFIIGLLESKTFFDYFDGIDVVLYNSSMQPLDQHWTADVNPLDSTLYWGGFKISDHGVPMTLHKNRSMTSSVAGNGQFRGQYTIESLVFKSEPITNPDVIYFTLPITLEIDLPFTLTGSDKVYADVDNIKIKTSPGGTTMNGFMKFTTFPSVVARDFFLQNPAAKTEADAGEFEPKSVAAAYGYKGNTPMQYASAAEQSAKTANNKAEHVVTLHQAVVDKSKIIHEKTTEASKSASDAADRSTEACKSAFYSATSADSAKLSEEKVDTEARLIRETAIKASEDASKSATSANSARRAEEKVDREAIIVQEKAAQARENASDSATSAESARRSEERVDKEVIRLLSLWKRNALSITIIIAVLIGVVSLFLFMSVFVRRK